MVSLDDKDFGVKIHWTKEMEVQERGRKVMRSVKIITALKAYVCFDVASERAIGWAFSGEKDKAIFEVCICSMYTNLLAWGLDQPYEAQERLKCRKGKVTGPVFALCRGLSGNRGASGAGRPHSAHKGGRLGSHSRRLDEPITRLFAEGDKRIVALVRTAPCRVGSWSIAQ